ncbi:MAG: peptidase M50 [Deltaproteobacteria bacterium]|nr:peptidase M50 [Deltaproteobacteria bacterium]
MVESIFSDSWYRVSALRPRLRAHAEIHHHVYRGTNWYVLQDHSTGQMHRFSEEAYHIIGLMDGRLTLDDIWEAACENLGDNMPTQEEVILLLYQLHRADLLQTDVPPDISDLHQRHESFQRNRLMGQLRSPLSVRIPILDPERFLSATSFLARPVFGWTGLILWLAVVTSALVLVTLHWPELTSNLTDRVLAMENIFLLWLCYPVVKILHEFGHAYAVKRWGGEVHEMGIMFLVFVPIPYMDATSATAFRKRYQRIIVGGAGIMVETFLAALAMWVWINVEPGVVRSLCFNVMIIAGVSTLLFNGNPLLRYDAYYMLSDWLEIPNLAIRANRYVGYLCRRYLLNIKEAQSPVSNRGEAPWMFFYGIASFLYRIFITIRIALFVAGKFFVIGIVLMLWGLISTLLSPLYNLIRLLVTDHQLRLKGRRVALISVVSIAMITVFSAVIPLPSFTTTEGVLWPPDNSQVTAGVDGFIKDVLASSNREVHRGDPLIICENPDIDSEMDVLEAEQRELEARYSLSLVKDRTEAEIIKDELARLKAEIERKRDEKDNLLIESPCDGIFVAPETDDLTGRFLRRGERIGYVVDFNSVTARVVLTQRDIDRVRTENRSVAVRTSDNIRAVFPAIIKREVPAASNELPSLALSIEGGGDLALDPKDNTRTFERIFQFEVLIPGVPRNTIGERVYVRFEHNPEPLVFRWYRGIRRTLLGRFNV